MFDQAARATWRVGAVPYVDLAALGALATLLQDVVAVSGAPSQLRDSSAALGSHDANRGDVHAAPAQDIPVRSVLQSARPETTQTPQWQALPVETRRTLTRLMVRLILDHVDGERAFRNERRRVMMSEKIRPHHLERKAILYVRQSSAHQVLHNRESSALQYAMRDRLTALGWSRIEIDRRRSRPLGGRRRRARRLRPDGGRGLPRQGRRRRGAGGLALRPQQP